MSELFVEVGTAITGIWGWFTAVLTNIETALSSSFLLALVFGLVAIYVGFLLIRKVIAIIKGFMG